MKILIKLSYLGTSFCGYQVQNDKRSIQGELTRAARELFSCDCDITGCSRTDSGVHANMFCATISKRGEECKVAVRNVRRDSLEGFKKQKKDGEITEDDLKNLETKIQKLTDKFVANVDTIIAAKEKEILEV